MAGEKYAVEEFKITPGAVTFNSVELGGTDGPVSITAEYSYYESKCNQAGEQVLRKIITSIKYKVKAKFKQIDKALVAALGSTKKVTTAQIGTDIYEGAQALQIAEIKGTSIHKFPKAVVLPESASYDIDGTAEHGIELEFECIGDTTGVIYEVTSAA